jgi:hypothetical protein
MACRCVRDSWERATKEQPSDLVSDELGVSLRDWVLESLVQGAWMREYHQWEISTKDYFDGHSRRSDGKAADWRSSNRSHVYKVRKQLQSFSGSIPDDVFRTIDQARDRVNAAKHEDEIFVTEAEYAALVTAIKNFWEVVESHEVFMPPGG